ncbi:MAG: DUF5711 family protein [Ruminococcus sp.]|nr:DUF5711 family protein [Ruminococcus sp.]
MFKKFKGKYLKKDIQKSERDVMSYEDMPLDDYEQEKTEISPEAVKKIIISISVVFVAGLIVFAFANREKLTWDNLSNWWTYDVLGNAGEGFPVDIVGSEVSPGNFTLNQGHIAYVSDTSFITLNTSGSEVANIQLRYSTPVLKTGGNRFLTYGLGTTGYQIDSFDNRLYSGDTEDNIYTGDIASNGVYTLVTEGNGYLAVQYVFNKDNNRIYKYSYSDYYITSTALNPSGNGCVSTGIATNKGAAITGVYVLDFTKDKPVSLYKIENDTILDSKYLANNRVVLIGQKAAYTFKVGDSKYTTIDYKNKTLANYTFNPDTSSFTLALSRSGDGRSCTIESYNSRGEITCTFNTDYKADSISMYKNVISILDGNIAYAYNNGGQFLYSCDTGAGSKQILMNSDSVAYVLSVNQIRQIDFKNPSTADTVSRKTESE